MNEIYELLAEKYIGEIIRLLLKKDFQNCLFILVLQRCGRSVLVFKGNGENEKWVRENS